MIIRTLKASLLLLSLILIFGNSNIFSSDKAQITQINLGQAIATSEKEKSLTEKTNVETVSVVKQTAPEEIPSKYLKGNLFKAIVIYFFVFISFTSIGMLILFYRVKMATTRAEKEKIMGHGILVPLFLIVVGGYATIKISNFSNTAFLPITAFMLITALGMFIQIKIRMIIKSHIAHYRIRCIQCGHLMNIVANKNNTEFLELEGIDYEVWNCESCDHVEKFRVALGRTNRCPKCKMTTITKTSRTLQAASYNDTGLELIIYRCKNPNCSYQKSRKRKIPKKRGSSRR